VLAEIVADVGVPGWLSYSIAGDSTRAGQPLEDAFAVATGVGALVAVGVNCCDPDDVAAALDVAARVTGKPGVAYPNSGQGWDNGTHSWVGPASYDVNLAPDWVARGAAYVGGCCQVGPKDIAALAQVLSSSRNGRQ
jgi:homocysteine S-methyltransferase